MNESSIIKNKLKNRSPSKKNKLKCSNLSIEQKSKTKSNLLNSPMKINRSIEKVSNTTGKINKSQTSLSMTPTSSKSSRRLYFIDEIIQLNKKLYYNQTDVQKKLKDIVGRKKNLSWNIGNICKKGDFEGYNKRLENYETYLIKKVIDTRDLVDRYNTSKDLKTQNSCLKNNLEIVSNIGEEKKQFYVKRLNSYTEIFSKEASELNNILKVSFPTSLNDLNHNNTFSEEIMHAFFWKLKQNFEILNKNIEIKEKEIQLASREKESILNEIAFWRSKLNRKLENDITTIKKHTLNNISRINYESERRNNNSEVQVYDNQIDYSCQYRSPYNKNVF